MDRANCPMRHENGNCLPCGGFCTAVNDSICEALHNAYRHGESDERDRLVLSMVEANAKYQKRQLKILRDIHKKVIEDTVNVVRCKDCKYYEHPEYYGGGTKDVCRTFKRQTKEDDFCSYGERKDN